MGELACVCGALRCTRHGRRTRQRPGYRAELHAARRRLEQVPRPWRCARCGELITEGEAWDAGHVVPAVLGGRLEVRHEHRSCNRAAGAALAFELRERSRFSPRARRIDRKSVV